jgi:hypothetical protein
MFLPFGNKNDFPILYTKLFIYLSFSIINLSLTILIKKEQTNRKNSIWITELFDFRQQWGICRSGVETELRHLFRLVSASPPKHSLARFPVRIL